MEKGYVLTFGKLSFVMGGVGIVVKGQADGEYGNEIFRGSIEDLHTKNNKDLHDRLEEMEVMSLDVEGNALLIGVDGE